MKQIVFVIYSSSEQRPCRDLILQKFAAIFQTTFELNENFPDVCQLGVEETSTQIDHYRYSIDLLCNLWGFDYKEQVRVPFDEFLKDLNDGLVNL